MSQRWASLDGLRGVAIITVVALHAGISPSRDWPSLLFDFLRSAGWMGVDLFFVLSGFLIGGILLDLPRNRRALLAFYARRILRIWPLYFATVAIGLLILPPFHLFPTSDTTEHGWVWLAFVQNIDRVANGPQPISLGSLWSLAVEEQMYLILPPVLLLTPRRRLAAVLIAMFGLAIVTRVATFYFQSGSLANYVLTTARFDAFSAGIAVAVLLRHGLLPRLLAPIRLAAITSAMLVLGIGVANFSLAWDASQMQTWGFSAVAVFCGCAVAMAIASPRVASALRWTPLRFFGKYSYSIYLFHYPLWFVVFPVLPQPTVLGSRLPAQIIAVMVMLGLGLALGWLSWRALERPILGLKRFFPYATAQRMNEYHPTDEERSAQPSLGHGFSA